MSWICRTNGERSGHPLEVRRGALTDIPVSDRDNWRVPYEVSPAVTNPQSQIVVNPTFHIQPDGSVQIRHQVIDRDVALVRHELRDRAEKRRDENLLKGVEVFGAVVDTNDKSLIRILGALKGLERGTVSFVRWKKKDGTHVNLDAAAVGAVLDAVLIFMQKNYDTEEKIIGEINAGVITKQSEVDRHKGWP